MCFVPNVIKSIIILYLLNCDLCHALDGTDDIDTTTVNFPVESEESFLPNSDTIKRIYEKIKESSDNKSNYEDIVFGGSDNNDNYKSLYDYNLNENNVCFLDNLKKNLLWWSHHNGSLVTNGEDSKLLEYE